MTAAEPTALPDPLRALTGRLAEALATVAVSDPATVASMLAPPPRAGMGDVALPCHRFAKAMGMTPPDAAAALAAAAADVDGVAEASSDGPFCNVTWDTATLAVATAALVDAARAAGSLFADDEGAGRTAIIEYSSPNAARKLAFHHLRGTVIGAALARLHEARGWNVVRLNFLGDYGHNIGQLLWKLAELRGDELTADERDGTAPPIPPLELQRLYVEANDEEKADPERVKAAAGGWLARLEADDETATTRWRMIVDATIAALDATYARLGVHFDEYRGESRYFRPALEVAQMLVERGVAEVDADNGSIFVPAVDKLQAIVLVNARGISTYEGRDCAAAIDRHDTWDFARMGYVTDVGQAGRFHAFFAALQRAGVTWADDLDHWGIGLMRLGGAKARTRQGSAVALDEVLDEAVERARAEIAGRDTVDAADVDVTAEQVGIGAVVFSQMRMRRQADFEFDLESAVAFKGETGPRMQYVVARVHSILERAGVDFDTAATDGDVTLLTDPLERAVLTAVAALPAAGRRAATEADPSHVADAVIAVADAWAAYQSAGARERVELRILVDDPALRAARLRLAVMAATAVSDGLDLLGVGQPASM